MLGLQGSEGAGLWCLYHSTYSVRLPDAVMVLTAAILPGIVHLSAACLELQAGRGWVTGVNRA